MNFPSLIPASFIARQNRFLAVADIDGREVECHIPNPGRMNELLFHGSKVYLTERSQFNRKTKYDVTITECEGNLVSIDSRMPNIIMREAIEEDLLPEFQGYEVEKCEPFYDNSRFDFRLSGPRGSMLLEVKSCTLVQKGLALFPDAPTLRGTRHLKTLIDSLKKFEAAIVFIIQRGDSNRFRANSITDPDFSRMLEKAFDKGVNILAYDTHITLNGISINRRVPVEI